MFKVVIIEKGGKPKTLEFDESMGSISIGRGKNNDIVLHKGNVSKHHARFIIKNGEFIIQDDNSTNGTYVNGAKIQAPKAITSSDKIFIGDFTMFIDDGEGGQKRAAPPPPPGGSPRGRRGAGGPPPPPHRRNKPAPSPLDDDLFPAAENKPSSPPRKKPPRKRPPANDPFDDDLFGDDLGLDSPAEKSSPKSSSPADDLEDDLGLGLESPPKRAPQRKGPPPRASRSKPKNKSEPLSLEDELGLEAPGGSPDSHQEKPQQQKPPRHRSSASGPGRQAPPQRRAPSRKKPGAQQSPSRSAPPRQKEPESKPEPQATPRQHKKHSRPKKAAKPRLDPKREKVVAIQKVIHDRLIEKMDLRRLNLDEIPEEELWDKTDSIICEIVDKMAANNKIPSFIDQDELIKDVLNEALGLGPLQDFLEDDTISEIMVNHATQIYLERDGKLVLSEKMFSSDKAVLGVIERIVAPLGRRIDESSPLVDARLKDGSRVNAIIPPLALKGPSITIRKFKKDVLGTKELIKFGTMTKGMADFLKMCVLARKNILISGGTGSGKTTTLNIISNFIPQGERIITIEDAAELQIQGIHWIQLESRPPNIEGTGAIEIRDLMKNTLRMRPDRIIVGECRGGEALDMLQAMNTGHDGSLTTVHANNPRDVLSRLETMVMMSGMELPSKAIREQIASAVDIIVQQTRFSDGSRKITYISEVTGMEGEIITMQDIFKFEQQGYDKDNKVLGKFAATGFMPKFYDDLRRKGIPVDMSIFQDN
ncbi:MAG: ATPase, T2SS/T4P/T4SS family [Myxococcota bacterium]